MNQVELDYLPPNLPGLPEVEHIGGRLAASDRHGQALNEAGDHRIGRGGWPSAERRGGAAYLLIVQAKRPKRRR